MKDTITEDERAKELLALTQQFLSDSHESYLREMTLDLSLQRHLGIDSIARAELARRIEDRFAVRLPNEVLAHAETLRDLLQVLVNEGAQTYSAYQQQLISPHQLAQVDLESSHTLTEVLVCYAEHASDQAYAFFQHHDGREEVITYGQLYSRALKVSATLRERDFYDGETIALLQSTHPDFFYAFFGILLAGGIPVLLAPVFTLDQAKNIISILRDAEVRSFITPLATKKYALLLRPFISNLKSVTTVTELLHQGKTVLPHHVKGHHPALIQYTTHPANPPVACLLRHEDLLANIRVEKVADTASCHANLIYQWLTCFYHGAPLVLKTTLEKHEFATESQMRKLRWRSGWQRVCNGVVTFAEVIYTAYLTIISLLTMLPILLYVSVSSRDRAAYAACLWAKIILLLSFCPVTIIGREKLYKKIPMVYVANHASYIDSIIMMAILPVSTRIIFKKELIHHPFIRFIMKKIDYLPVDRLDYIQGIEDTQRFVSTLKAKHSVMIFPEGTFGYVTGLRPFKLGAFKIAAETATPVCSIALKGTRRIWRDVESLLRPGRITVTVCDPIMPTGDDWKAVTALRQKVKTEIVKYCGEPALDWMIAQPIAPRHRKNEC